MDETVRIRLADERLIRGIEVGIIAISLGLSVGALALGRLASSLGVLAGGTISLLNLIWIASIVRRLLTNQGSMTRFAASLTLKESILLGAVGVLIGLRLVDPIGLLIGLSGLIPAVTIAALGKRTNLDLPRKW